MVHRMSTNELIGTLETLLAHLRAETGAKKARRTHVRHDFHRKARVLEYAAKHGGFVTTDDVIKAEGCSGSTARSTLSLMCKNGSLTRVFRGRYAIPRH